MKSGNMHGRTVYYVRSHPLPGLDYKKSEPMGPLPGGAGWLGGGGSRWMDVGEGEGGRFGQFCVCIV